MPVPTRVQPEKNIWVAASDGDLPRVQELIERQGLSPNVADPNTYTPMHAAASYGHIHVLEYLVSKGGDVNLTDEDGDTPLYVVENMETARWLVEHGAVVDRRNHEDISPAGHLAEDFPEVSEYLESMARTIDADATQPSQLSASYYPSEHAQNQATESLTSSLVQSVQDIMQRAEEEGRDPDEELRAVVGRTVIEGMTTGYSLGAEQSNRHGEDRSEPDSVKRSRTDNDSS